MKEVFQAVAYGVMAAIAIECVLMIVRADAADRAAKRRGKDQC